MSFKVAISNNLQMQKRFMLRRLTACFAAVFLALGITAVCEKVPLFDWPNEIEWVPQFVGIELATIQVSKPRPLVVYALRVDLQTDGVSVCTNNDNGELSEETFGLRTSSFLKKKGCQVAINGAPFWPGRAKENLGQNVAGLVVSEGLLISPLDQNQPRSALVFRKGIATIETPPIELVGVETAVGGFGVVLRDGKPFRDNTTPADVIEGVHPRTAVATADEGKALLLLVVDGRQAGYSEGITLGELGELFLMLGAIDALNLDGGGTSTMVKEDANNLPKQVSRPIDGGVVGQERVAASHLGIYAHSLNKQLQDVP